MEILDKNNREVTKGLYKGPGAAIYGPVRITNVLEVGPDGCIYCQSITGFGPCCAYEAESWERIEDPLEFVKWLQYMYSPSSRVVQFMKSLLWDYEQEQIVRCKIQ